MTSFFHAYRIGDNVSLLIRALAYRRLCPPYPARPASPELFPSRSFRYCMRAFARPGLLPESSTNWIRGVPNMRLCFRKPEVKGSSPFAGSIKSTT